MSPLGHFSKAIQMDAMLCYGFYSFKGVLINCNFIIGQTNLENVLRKIIKKILVGKIDSKMEGTAWNKKNRSQLKDLDEVVKTDGFLLGCT